MNLTKKLSTKQFVASQFILLLVGLIFLGSLYYVLYIQYQYPPNKLLLLEGPITSPPKTLRIELDQPDDDSLFFEPQILVSGKAGPNLEVLITTEFEDLVVKSTSEGKFSTILNLSEGLNKITAVVFDASGESRSTERNVYFSKEKL